VTRDRAREWMVRPGQPWSQVRFFVSGYGAVEECRLHFNRRASPLLPQGRLVGGRSPWSLDSHLKRLCIFGAAMGFEPSTPTVAGCARPRDQGICPKVISSPVS
jgi:hypothetical protein